MASLEYFWRLPFRAASAWAADESSAIRLNTVGYLPRAEKQVSIAAPCTNFTVVRVSDNQTVFTGKITGPVLNADTGESLYTADFSSVKKPGDYRLVVPGVGQSAPFHIAADVYREPYYTVMRGFYLWRCGIAVSSTYHGETFAHAACHTNDAWLDFVGGGHTHKDGTKGWHDAGDYNKYTVNAGVTVGVLFRAWEDFGPQLRKVRLDHPGIRRQAAGFSGGNEMGNGLAADHAGAGRLGVSQIEHQTISAGSSCRSRKPPNAISRRGAARPPPISSP